MIKKHLFNCYTYEGIHAVVRKLKRGETQLNEDIGDEEDDVQLQPIHVHHKMLK